MDFVGAIKAGFQNYVNFRGTASRPEYWYWVLFTVLVGLVLGSIDESGSLATAFSIATLLPTLGVTVRRLRDAGFSWVWLLLPVPGLIPFSIGFFNFVNELYQLGLENEILMNPELVDQDTIMALIENEAILGSILLILVSTLYALVTSVVVQIIFAAQKSKSFEDGNKRVAPKGPESQAL
jgi:uncharacterized membrane protein YhaH (DUF805 family)